jgi:Cu-Zn family superoxide dismutase
VFIGIEIFMKSSKSQLKKIEGIAVFQGKVSGIVKFTDLGNKVAIDVSIKGLKKNAKHGFHVHEYGDMSEQCTSMCSHFNPTNDTHGCPGSEHRHVGDLGNLETDGKGVAHYRFFDDQIQLKGLKYNIIGRGLIIHEDEDDCGFGGNAESLKTGNAGKRIACAVIGYAKPESC